MGASKIRPVLVDLVFEGIFLGHDNGHSDFTAKNTAILARVQLSLTAGAHSMKKPRPHAVDIQVGALLRTRRHMLGVSQEDLGGGLGVSFQQIQKYENGANRISASRLHAISILLNVSIEFFFQSEERPLTQKAGLSSEASQMLASKENVAFNKAFLKIGNSKIRASIVELIDALGGPDDTLLAEREDA